MNTCPVVGVSSPARQCISVDFPDPDGPHDGDELAGGERDVDVVKGHHPGITRAVDLGQSHGPGSGGGLDCLGSGAQIPALRDRPS